MVARHHLSGTSAVIFRKEVHLVGVGDTDVPWEFQNKGIEEFFHFEAMIMDLNTYFLG